MKRPLVPVALLYTGGLLLASVFRLPLWFLWTAAFILASGAFSRSAVNHWFLAGLLIFTGWANLTWRTAILSPHDLRLSIGQTPRLVTLQGRLLETPSERIYIRDDKESWRSIARIAVERMKEEGKT